MIKELRTIQTVRDLKSMNIAVDAGFKPLLKKIVPNPEIKSKYKIVRHKESGHLQWISDYRMEPSSSWEHDTTDLFETVIDWSWYYPHHHSNPFGAYLIPPDIEIGERVFIEDLIEDLIGNSWNQGDNYRLKSAEAIWNGTDLEVQYDEKRDKRSFMG